LRASAAADQSGHDPECLKQEPVLAIVDTAVKHAPATSEHGVALVNCP
jgi:hypothetical protein